jgi:hypothetical protein
MMLVKFPSSKCFFAKLVHFSPRKEASVELKEPFFYFDPKAKWIKLHINWLNNLS